MSIRSAGAAAAFLALVWLASPGAVHAASEPVEFSADLLITGPDSSVKARLFVRGETIHRVEMSKEAGGTVYLRPPKARGNIWVLDPAKKQYSTLGWPQKHRDPVEAWTDIQYDMGGRAVSEETVNGFPCAVYHFKYKGEDKVSLKMWFAEDLKYTIKREANAKIPIANPAEPESIKGTFEVLNIKVEKLDDSLFEIPGDYVQVE